MTVIFFHMPYFRGWDCEMQVSYTYLCKNERIYGLESVICSVNDEILREGEGMPSAWGRPPRNDLWQDLQALALWILIIGVVGYILFPNFFKDIYSRISDPVTQTSTLNDNYTLNNSANLNTNANDSQGMLGQDVSSVANALYSNGKNEVSAGYWVIYVAEGEFKQLAVSSDAYAFLLRLIESDQNVEGKNTVILAANGQIRKYTVSEEIYAIINNMAVIVGRANT